MKPLIRLSTLVGCFFLIYDRRWGCQECFEFGFFHHFIFFWDSFSLFDGWFNKGLQFAFPTDDVVVCKVKVSTGASLRSDTDFFFLLNLIQYKTNLCYCSLNIICICGRVWISPFNGYDIAFAVLVFKVNDSFQECRCGLVNDLFLVHKIHF